MPRSAAALLWLVACSSSNPKSVTLEVTGTASVPGGSPPLWIVVEAQDGAHLGAGATDATGRFSFSVDPPRSGSVILALAVDPDDPERMAIGVIHLVSTLSDPDSDVMAEPAEIDARSTAEVWLRDVRGDIATPLTGDDLARLGTVEQSLGDPPPSLCSGAGDTTASTALREETRGTVPPVRDRFDRHASGSGDLLARLRAAQADITNTVESANQFNRYQVFTLGMNGLSGIHRTRWAIANLTGLPTHGLPKELTEAQLEIAAQVGMDVGWGNCREKGMLGAYAATRFAEFAQVSVFGLSMEEYFGAHAVAIACTGASSVYDLSTYGTSIDEDALFPSAMLEADCYVIDPWAGTTERFSRELVEQGRWLEILDGAVVLGEPSPVPPAEMVGVCSVDGDDRRCAPFTIGPIAPASTCQDATKPWTPAGEDCGTPCETTVETPVGTWTDCVGEHGRPGCERDPPGVTLVDSDVYGSGYVLQSCTWYGPDYDDQGVSCGTECWWQNSHELSPAWYDLGRDRPTVAHADWTEDLRNLCPPGSLAEYDASKDLIFSTSHWAAVCYAVPDNIGASFATGRAQTMLQTIEAMAWPLQ